MNDKYINLTPKSLKELKKAYAKAVEQNQESFLFDGMELVTMYAKYLIQYGETKIK